MKIFIISHISDPDGVTPIILAKLVFNEVESLLVEAAKVSDAVLKLINNHELDNYDMIYITDLGLNEEVLNIIETNIILKNKVRLFDHHIGNDFANKYSFATVIDIDQEGTKQSGTSLFYDYLIKHYNNEYLKKDSVCYFVNLVREYDTWEWVKTNNEDAKRLAHLFGIYGRDYFAEHFLLFLKQNDTFFFEDKELFLLEMEQHQIDGYIAEKKENVISVSCLNHKVGLVFASRFRSELGNTLANDFVDLYDFIIIVNVERGISYRGIKDIDLNEVAKVFGGKGHINSSGSPLPSNLQKDIVKIIFGHEIDINN